MPAISPSANSDASSAFWLIADQLNTRNDTERLAYMRTGFPPGWVKAVRNAFHLSNSQLEALLSSSVSTLERRQRQHRPLDLVGSERLARVAAVAVRAAAIFGSQAAAQRWMVTPNRALGEQIPISLCATEIGGTQVHRVLAALEHGGVC